MNGNFMYMVPIFGMVFVGWISYLSYREKQFVNKEKAALIEKGLDPSLLDRKPIISQDGFKTGLILIGAAVGILTGYIINLTLGIPIVIAYSTMILVICGALLIAFHRSKN